MNAAALQTANLSQAARSRFLALERKPMLVCDWRRALFLHFEVPADLLRPCVPFDLDLWEGRALVSGVAFSMEQLHPELGGALGRWLFRPIASHEFFNVRAYVRHHGNPGIYFIREWVNNRLCALGGPAIYGLPYRFGRIEYNHCPGACRLSGTIGDGFAYTAKLPPCPSFHLCAGGSQEEFLFERYTGFTRRGGCARYFDIAHEPWSQIPVTAHVTDDRLLRSSFPWFAQARLVGAHYSPGVRNVWLGAPRPIDHLSPGPFDERT